LVWSYRVVSKFHYTDPQTLFATPPDPRTKSVHVEIWRDWFIFREATTEKVRWLVEDPSGPAQTLSETRS